jgi:hypothetical protein
MLRIRTSNVPARASTPSSSRISVRSILGIGVALAAVAALIGTASPAAAAGPLLHADGDDVGKRWTVCAQDLTVRSTPGGPVIGTLTGPQAGRPAQSFTIDDPTAQGGEWVHGHAWGHVNQDGYVQNGWFCPDNPAGPTAPANPVSPPATTTPAAPTQSKASAAATTCLSPFYAAANPPKDSVSPIPIANNGWRSYSIGLSSYLRRCGGYVYARHCLYIDTRNLPYGHQVWFTVSTQRSDGKWARAHTAPILSISGRQKIQEVCLRQRRGVVVAGRQLAITQVHVRHTATTPGDGALIPRGSTLKGVYKPYNGPEAKPAR